MQESTAVPRLHVLIVEDDRDTAETTATLVRLGGCDASVARDGASALRQMMEAQPDVVLLDIGLPGMDGYEVARKMREQCNGRRPLFIAVTGYGQEEDRRLSADVGIDLHLLKPVDPERLQNLLKRFANIVLPPASDCSAV